MKKLRSIWKWIRTHLLRWPTSEAEAFLMSLALVLCCVWFITYGKLVETQIVVRDNTKVITEQRETIKILKVKESSQCIPSKTKVIPVTQTELQQAIRRANAEAEELRQAKRYYQDLARKNKKADPVSRNPAQRVSTEEHNNDQFIQDWKSGQ